MSAPRVRRRTFLSPSPSQGAGRGKGGSRSSSKGEGWGEDKGVPASLCRSIRRRLLNWYDHHRRDLPWRRRAGDAYAQWVAEIMLQQTRVETVAPYYEQFMARFPNVKALAEADFEEVLKCWEGLGYYRRAFHLHQAARRIRERGGVIPDTVAGLRELPGIGEYTASAIASIAFGRRSPAVDGNVARVLTRLFQVHEDPLNGHGRKIVRQMAQSLIPPRRAGDFNQAWMDLGSTICTPREPKCSQCPLANICKAVKSGDAGRLPVRATRRKVRQVCCTVGVFHDGGRVLVRRREVGGLWSGLWEFPNIEVPGPRRARAAIHRLAEAAGVGLDDEPRKAATVRHELTHQSIRFEVYVGAAAPASALTQAPNHRWVHRRGFRKLPVSTAHRRIFEAVLRQRDNQSTERKDEATEKGASSCWRSQA